MGACPPILPAWCHLGSPSSEGLQAGWTTRSSSTTATSAARTWSAPLTAWTSTTLAASTLPSWCAAIQRQLVHDSLQLGAWPPSPVVSWPAGGTQVHASRAAERMAEGWPTDSRPHLPC